MRNRKLFLCSILVLALAVLHFSGITGFTVKADKRAPARALTTTPQPLPFSQNWTNAGLITANDDWSGVPGITGYLGDFDAGAVTNVDPRTLTVPFAINNVDVIANQASVALTNGGVGEFDTIANPVVALQGSGTADAPSLVIYLDTTGKQNINFTCNIRDIDDSADNATQQVDVQYRVGGAGNYTSITGGYIADASSGPSTTMSTPLNLNLPAAADNQAQLEIRIITTNAIGSDEWVGADDISVTGTNIPAVNQQHIGDWDGDGKTDYALARNTGGGPGGTLTWFVQQNGGASQFAAPWGSQGDEYVPEDYNGDNKTDYAIWRTGPAGNAGWYILINGTNVIRQEAFGQTGDDPSVVGDYNGDGSADMAVYRTGVGAGQPSNWYYRTAAAGPTFAIPWGQNGDFSVPGDFDGDGKSDFAVQRNFGGGQAVFIIHYATAGNGVISRFKKFGTPTDVILPGDYDGDGKTDLCIVRGQGGQIIWALEPSSALDTEIDTLWGTSATDFPAVGDYDGDGKSDIAVWRPDANPSNNFFLIKKSSDGALQYQEWGQNGDYPVLNYNNH